MDPASESGPERVAELERELEAAREAAAAERRSREHTEQWYAERMAALEDEAKRVGNWDRVASILANGTPDPLTPPTHAQLLNAAEHRAAAAEQRAAKLEHELADLRAQRESEGGCSRS